MPPEPAPHGTVQGTPARESGFFTPEPRRYRFLHALGTGGMAQVHAALDLHLNRRVAIKLAQWPPSGAAGGDDALLREARLLSCFSHPNIVSVFDWGKSPAGRPYYSMELIRGVTLRELVVMRGPLPHRQVAQIVLQLCDALSAVHDSGLVHNDVTPANVMLLEDGPVPARLKLIDFGVARRMHREPRRFSIVGTHGYIAPEVLHGDAADTRSDLYSVGALARYLLTGVAPGTGTTTEPDSADADYGMPSLDALSCDVGWVRSCLSDVPSVRPRSAIELAERVAASMYPRGALESVSRRAPETLPPPAE